MPPPPLLSVLMPTRNRARYIERAINSVLDEVEHDYPNTEFWVVDGASTDGTVEILKKYEGRIKWLSEPDKGVSDAVNKVLPMLRGKYVRGIGDDDRIYPGNFSKMIAFAEANPEFDIIGAQARWLLEGEDGSQIDLHPKQPSGPVSYEDMLALGVGIGWFTPESTISKLSLYRRLGGYDLDYHYWAYWEFWLRALQSGAKMHVLPLQVMERIQTPLSDGILGQRPGNLDRWNDERHRILKRYGGARWVWFHRCDGDPSFKGVFCYLAKRACALLRFHPRAQYRSLLRRLSAEPKSDRK